MVPAGSGFDLAIIAISLASLLAVNAILMSIERANPESSTPNSTEPTTSVASGIFEAICFSGPLFLNHAKSFSPSTFAR